MELAFEVKVTILTALGLQIRSGIRMMEKVNFEDSDGHYRAEIEENNAAYYAIAETDHPSYTRWKEGGQDE